MTCSPQPNHDLSIPRPQPHRAVFVANLKAEAVSMRQEGFGAASSLSLRRPRSVEAADCQSAKMAPRIPRHAATSLREWKCKPHSQSAQTPLLGSYDGAAPCAGLAPSFCAGLDLARQRLIVVTVLCGLCSFTTAFLGLQARNFVLECLPTFLATAI
jgi:hypothetical protein